MSLLLTYYSIHYYPSWVTDNNVNPANPPNMGNYMSCSSYCNSWYNWNSGGTPPNVSVYYPTFAGAPNPWSKVTPNPTPIDYYVIAGEVQNKSQSNEFIPFIDQQLANTLFGSAGLNIPMDPFVAQDRPHGFRAPGRHAEWLRWISSGSNLQLR